jgi:hypothetical protein
MSSFWTKRIEISWLTLIAYCLGTLVIIFGAVGLATDIESPPVRSVPTVTAIYGTGPFLMIWGSLICVATRLRYHGGLWFLIGAFLIEGVFMGVVSIVEGHLRGWYYVAPLWLYTRLIIFGVVGCVFLVLGHRRHLRKKQMQPNTALEPTPTAP